AAAHRLRTAGTRHQVQKQIGQTGIPVSTVANAGATGATALRTPIMADLRKFHNATRRTFVPTRELQADLERCGFQGLRVVSRGVDTQRFHPAHRDEALRRSWTVAPDGLAVLCLGRLAPEKNLDLLLRAFDALALRVPGARMVLVGDGPLRASLQARRTGYHFAGQRAGEDLARHVASADLFLFPSMSETFGNVVTESMASGVPVLAFGHAAALQLIGPGHDGQRVPLGDEAAFVDAAVAAALDRPQLAQWSKEARRTVEPLDWSGIVERFEAELREALHPAVPEWRVSQHCHEKFSH
ncbi:MAG: glycosyltransferase, partial [Rubrivivax sp.]